MDTLDMHGVRRVRRDELVDSSSEADSSSDHAVTSEEYAHLQAELNKQLSFNILLDTQSKPQAEDQVAPKYAQRADDKFEFRLFSTADTKKKIALLGENEILDHEARLVKQRPVSYYIPGSPNAGELNKFQHSARTGEEVLRLAQRPNWGMQMPWRVTHITTTTVSVKGISPLNINTNPSSVGEVKAKKRPGKKFRIELRKAERQKAEMAVLAERERLEKEDHVKEKKKRLNRAKKLKRRAQTKAGNKGSHPEPGEENASRADECISVIK